MTRKDYELIAAAVRESVTARGAPPDAYVAVAYLAHVLAASLRADNPRFDKARFLKACGVAEPLL